MVLVCLAITVQRLALLPTEVAVVVVLITKLRQQLVVAVAVAVREMQQIATITVLLQTRVLSLVGHH